MSWRRGMLYGISYYDKRGRMSYWKCCDDNRGELPPLYFWRDRTGHEVDIIIDAGKTLIPVEVKSSETVAASLFDGLKYFTSLGAPAATTGVVVHGGDAMYKRDGFTVRPWYYCV